MMTMNRKPNLLSGQLIAVYNKMMAIDSRKNNCDVIYVGDMTGLNSYEANMFINGSILIPNVRAMQYLVIDEKNSYRKEYLMQLNTDPNVSEYIETIVCALFKGKTIVLYVPEEALEFNYHEILFQFFRNAVGLNIQKGPNDPFYFDTSYTPQILTILLKYQMIDRWYYLYMMPEELMNDMMFMRNIILPSMGYNYTEENIQFIIGVRKEMDKKNKVIRPAITYY